MAGIAHVPDDVASKNAPNVAPEAVLSPCPDAESIKKQLERIFDSSEFQGTERMRRFLHYVVDETLAGRPDRIKAYTVAIAAFDRDEDFDPQSDPIVRIEAGRLRRCLERYYLVAGAGDPVRIEIPKGSYVPVFSWMHDQRTDAPSETVITRQEPRLAVVRHGPLNRPWMRLLLAGLVVLSAIGFGGFLASDTHLEPKAPALVTRSPAPLALIAVLPFESAGAPVHGRVFSAGMTNEVIRELSRYSGVLVLGGHSLLQMVSGTDLATIRRETNAAFALSGDVQQAGDSIRVAVRLIDTQTGVIIWAERYDRVLDPASAFDLQAEIGREIVRKIAHPRGAIATFDWKRTRGMAPETWVDYDCVIQAAELRRRGELMDRKAELRACLTRATERAPGYAEPWIMLSLLEVDALRYTPQTELLPEKFDVAVAAAQRGIDLAPDSGKARMALMLSLFFRGDIERALAVGDIALRLSPQDPDVIGEVGLRHVIGGSPDRGIVLLLEAISFYDDPPPNLRVSLSLGYLRRGKIEEALRMIDTVAPNSNFVYMAVASAVYGTGQRTHDARQVRAELLELYPGFPDWAYREVTQRYLSPDLATTLIRGWEAADLTADTATIRH